MATKVFVILMMMAGTIFLPPHSTAQPRKASPARVNAPARYACPMHPEVQSSRRGKRCPKCGMALRLVKEPIAAPVNQPANTQPELSRFPDVRLYDQNGNPINFYRDLIKGKTVAINFIFTTCTTACPALTATFRRVQQDMAASAIQAQLISVSVDPATDTPERLREFAAKFKAGPGWTFVTGETNQIESLLQALGLAVANKTEHTATILIGNDEINYWTRAYGLSSPAVLVKLISEAADRK